MIGLQPTAVQHSVPPVPTSWVAPTGCYARASGADPAKTMPREERGTGGLDYPTPTRRDRRCSFEAHSPDRTAKMVFFVVFGFCLFVGESTPDQPPGLSPTGTISRAVERPLPDEHSRIEAYEERPRNGHRLD